MAFSYLLDSTVLTIRSKDPSWHLRLCAIGDSAEPVTPHIACRGFAGSLFLPWWAIERVPKIIRSIASMYQIISWSDRVSFSKLLRTLFYHVPGLWALPSRRTILVLYVSLLYVLLPPPWNKIQTSQQVGGPLVEIAPNNSSAIHARYSNLIAIYSVLLTLHSGSFFPHSKNIVVHDGTFYAANKLVIKQIQGEESP